MCSAPLEPGNESLDWEYLDETDSTSRLAREYLSTSPIEAKAFIAKVQSSGVGRMGRGWESLEGNLHMSIALPANRVLTELRDVLPIAAGVIISEWVARRVRAAPTLKWPNDIVMDGHKVGGILCEASITGATWNGAVIGIGINLVVAPSLTDDVSYQASSLFASTAIKISPLDASRQLATEICHVLQTTARSSIMERYRRFATSSGQFWTDESGNIFLQGEFEDDGLLRLSPPDGSSPAPRVISSSEHKFRWTGLSTKDVLVGDIGNSRIKLGYLRRRGVSLEVIDSAAFHPDDTEHARSWLKEKIVQGILPMVHFVSVDQDRFIRFKSELRSTGILSRLVERKPSRNLNSDYDLQKLGLDRLAIVEAVLAMMGWRSEWQNCMAVSLGTATTIDFMTMNGRHLGGLIGVGLVKGLEALHLSAAALPRVDLVREGLVTWLDLPGATEQAMASAAIRMQAAWIEKEYSAFVARSQNTLHDAMTSLILTGGNAPLVAPLLSPYLQVKVIPDLVLLGAGVLATSSS